MSDPTLLGVTLKIVVVVEYVIAIILAQFNDHFITHLLLTNQEGKTNLDLLEQEIVSGSGVSWVICKSAPRPRHITTTASHHLWATVEWFFHSKCTSMLCAGTTEKQNPLQSVHIN